MVKEKIEKVALELGITKNELFLGIMRPEKIKREAMITKKELNRLYKKYFGMEKKI